jgi:hypothetical protein
VRNGSSYDLGFVALSPGYDEIALETAPEQNITRILLDRGTGFAFVGRQKEVVDSAKIPMRAPAKRLGEHCCREGGVWARSIGGLS